MIRPFFTASDAQVQVGYRPLLLSQATISNVATAESGRILENVSVVATTMPAAAPVRNVVGRVIEGSMIDSGAFDPGAPISVAKVVLPVMPPTVPIRRPSGPNTCVVPMPATRMLKVTVPWANTLAAAVSVIAESISFFIVMFDWFSGFEVPCGGP